MRPLPACSAALLLIRVSRELPQKARIELRCPLSTRTRIFPMTLFFSFLAAPGHVEFPDQGSDLGHSADLRCSCDSAGSFNPQCWARVRTYILALQKHHQSCCATARTPPCDIFNFQKQVQFIISMHSIWPFPSLCSLPLQHSQSDLQSRAGGQS